MTTVTLLGDLNAHVIRLFSVSEFQNLTLSLDALGDLDKVTSVHSSYTLRVPDYTRQASKRGCLEALLTRLEVERPTDDPLAATIAGLRDAMGVTQDRWFRQPEFPAEAPVVDGHGIADRAQLRRYLRDLSTHRPPRRLLLLHGNALAGKSFSQRLIQYVASRCGQAFVYIDVQFWDLATAPLVAEAIVSKLGLAPITSDNHTTVERNVEMLARDVADRIHAMGRVTWLFLDHLDTAAPDPTVGKLVQKLAFLAQREDYDLRIVVGARTLTKADVFGAVVSPYSLAEEVVQVADADIEAYFGEIGTRIGTPFDVGQRADARRRVREHAGAEPIDLAPALWNVVTELFAP